VNCLTAMKRVDEARAASEQARRLLETMPQAALEPGIAGDAASNESDSGSSVMSKTYFEQWLRWSATPASSTH
jgi:hypothetical protein